MNKYYFMCSNKRVIYIAAGKITDYNRDTGFVHVDGFSYHRSSGFGFFKNQRFNSSGKEDYSHKYKEYIVSKKTYERQSVRFIFEEIINDNK